MRADNVIRRAWSLERPDTAAQNAATYVPTGQHANRLLTPWFSGAIPPVNPGPYRRRIIEEGKHDVGGEFAYWTGEKWRAFAASPDEAARKDEWQQDSRLQPRNNETIRTQWQGLVNEYIGEIRAREIYLELGTE